MSFFTLQGSGVEKTGQTTLRASVLNAQDNDLPVFMVHDENRACDNPYSTIGRFEQGVVVGLDPEGQPYIYPPHWTALEADMDSAEWEHCKKHNKCLVIGW